MEKGGTYRKLDENGYNDNGADGEKIGGGNVDSN